MSLKELLETESGNLIRQKEIIEAKHDDKKGMIEEMLIQTVQSLTYHSLHSVVRNGKYTLFKARPMNAILGDIEYKNIFIGRLRFTENMSCGFESSCNYKLVDQGYDPNTNKLNTHYMYKLFKKYARPIGDVQPVFNDDTEYVGYEWNVSANNSKSEEETKKIRDEFLAKHAFGNQLDKPDDEVMKRDESTDDCGSFDVIPIP